MYIYIYIYIYICIYIIYIIQRDDYNKYVKDNVTKTYEPSTAKRVKNINYESKLLAPKLATDYRTETEA